MSELNARFDGDFVTMHPDASFLIPGRTPAGSCRPEEHPPGRGQGRGAPTF